MRKTLAFVLAGAAAVTACSGGSSAGGGQNVSRTYQVGSFHEVELAGHYRVDIRTGGPVSVTAQGPAKVLDRLRVEVNGDKLTIGQRANGGWFHFGHPFSREPVHLEVTVPTLTAATLAGSGVLNVDKVEGASFEGTVAGSGDLNLGSISLQSLKLNIAGSGSASAGHGQAQLAEFDIAGSGSLEAAAIQARDLKVSIAGSGGVRANATGTASVEIMGSGDVAISGGAKCTITKAGSGNVRCS